MRESVFSGSFYPKQKAELGNFIKSALDGATPGNGKPISIIVPHAGYIYSGRTAAYAYKCVYDFRKDYDSVIILGPNHTGLGAQIGVSEETWKTPLGTIHSDTELAKEICDACDIAEIDEQSHAEEHSVEVQLPFIQYIFGSIPMVAVCMGVQDFKASECMYNAISKASRKLGRKPLIVASSDFNHYESAHEAESKDLPLIKMLEKLDAKGFNDGVVTSGDSACGYGPSTVATLYAKAKGAKKGVLLKYSNSGMQTGDLSSVVAYASIAFF
ncbi:MAG: AmmeMemoRadiSam system protein B [Methanothrix sp.]